MIGGVDVFGAWNGTITALDLRTPSCALARHDGCKVTSSAADLRPGRSISATTAAGCSRSTRGRARSRWSRQRQRARLRDAGGRGRSRLRAELDRRLADRVLDQRALPLAPGDRLVRLLVAGRQSQGRVFFGSYNGVFYALRARDGATLWSRHTGGPISGAAVVVDGVAYAGSFAHRILGVDVGKRPRRARLPARRVRPGVGRWAQAAAARVLAPVRGGGAVKRVLLAVCAARARARRSGARVLPAGAARVRDVKGSSTVEFVTTGVEAPPPPPKEPGVAWPTYGQNPERQRFANGVSARAAVPARLDVPRAGAGRVPAGGRVRAAVLRQQRGRRSSRSARRTASAPGSTSPTAVSRPRRRSTPGRLRDVHERAAVQPQAERAA